MTECRKTAMSSEGLTFEDIQALNDEDGEPYFFSKGHHDQGEFLTAVQKYLEWETDGDYVLSNSAIVEWGWAKFIPNPEGGAFFNPVGHRIRSGRGVFAYTGIQGIIRREDE